MIRKIFENSEQVSWKFKLNFEKKNGSLRKISRNSEQLWKNIVETNNE